MRNIGKLIKETACVLGGLVAVAGILITGAVDLSEFPDEEIMFILCVVGSLLTGWIVGLLMFGFGQLVENSDIQTALLLKKEQENQLENNKD